MEEHINKKITAYIRENWLKDSFNNTSFALAHLVDEATVKEIKSNPDYKISLDTIIRICYSERVTLEEFFKRVGV